MTQTEVRLRPSVWRRKGREEVSFEERCSQTGATVWWKKGEGFYRDQSLEESTSWVNISSKMGVRCNYCLHGHWERQKSAAAGQDREQNFKVY